MKLKHAALFLLLGAAIEVFTNFYHHISTIIIYKMYDLTLMQWLYFIMTTIGAAALGLVGLSVYRKNGFSAVRPFALFLAIVSACWVLLGFYNLMEGFIKSWDWFAENKLRVLSFLLMQMVPVSILIFALSLLRPGNIRRGSWWLFAGTTAWLIMLYFDRFTMLLTYGFAKSEETTLMIRDLLKFVSLAYPISMIIFALRLPDNRERIRGGLNNDNLLDELPEEEEISVEEETSEFSLKQWMGTFLLSSVPLVGTIILIAWAANLKSRVRGNWAAAMFLLQTLLLLIYTIAYVEPMAYLMGMRDLKFYLALMVFVFLTTAIGLIVYRRNNLAYEEQEQQVPSIGKWIGDIFLAGLPFIGLILLIVWANEKADRIRRNWAVAQLIWLAVMLVYYFYAYMAVLDIREYQTRSTFQF